MIDAHCLNQSVKYIKRIVKATNNNDQLDGGFYVYHLELQVKNK